MPNKRKRSAVIIDEIRYNPSIFESRGSQTSRVNKTRNLQWKNSKPSLFFSGGQDSATCLIQAIQTYGRENVQAITFQYGQRHAIELERARWIAQDLGVKRTVLDLSLMQQITHNALMDDTAYIETAPDGLPNTFVDGRNALFCFTQLFTPKGRGYAISLLACAKPIFPVIPTAAMCSSSR